VVGLITEWQDDDGIMHKRDSNTDLGGTMRLGNYVCKLKDGSKAKSIYASNSVVERHRHRYEVNNNYVEALENVGLIFSGRSEDGSLMELIEIPTHKWFVACQAHPEFTSTPRYGHKLFESFVAAAIENSK
jgi:CTP synthase